jgi:hypothetical protein
VSVSPSINEADGQKVMTSKPAWRAQHVPRAQQLSETLCRNADSREPLVKTPAYVSRSSGDECSLFNLVAVLGGSPLVGLASGWLVTRVGSAPLMLVVNGTALTLVWHCIF